MIGLGCEYRTILIGTPHIEILPFLFLAVAAAAAAAAVVTTTTSIVVGVGYSRYRRR